VSEINPANAVPELGVKRGFTPDGISKLRYLCCKSVQCLLPIILSGTMTRIKKRYSP